MKKFMKFFTLILVVATLGTVMAFSLAGCGGNKLTVATEAKFAPYEYVEGGKYVGFDMELMEAIAKKMGYDGIQVKDVEFDAIIGEVTSNKDAVAIAAMTIDAKRAKSVLFSTPYLTAAYQVLVVEKSNTKFDGKTKDEIFALLNGTTINYAIGQTGQYLVEGDEEREYPGITGATGVSCKDAPTAVTTITNGQVALVDNAVAAEICASNSNLKMIDVSLTDEKYGIAINKANPEMKTAIDKALAELVEDGTVAALMEKYEIVNAK